MQQLFALVLRRALALSQNFYYGFHKVVTNIDRKAGDSCCVKVLNPCCNGKNNALSSWRVMLMLILVL